MCAKTHAATPAAATMHRRSLRIVDVASVESQLQSSPPKAHLSSSRISPDRENALVVRITDAADGIVVLVGRGVL